MYFALASAGTQIDERESPSLARPLLFSDGMDANQTETPVPSGDVSQIAFRLCKLLLARRVLWDEYGLGVEELAKTLGTSAGSVREALGDLESEQWVDLCADRSSAALTEKGVVAILGRKPFASAEQRV